jgi:hypothetical protein
MNMEICGFKCMSQMALFNTVTHIDYMSSRLNYSFIIERILSCKYITKL